jgi:hypothetical protein
MHGCSRVAQRQQHPRVKSPSHLLQLAPVTQACAARNAKHYSLLMCVSCCVTDTAADSSWHGSSSRQLLQDCSVCPEDKNPVCAIDGRTFDNWCLAECVGMEVDYVGACGTAGAANQVPGTDCAAGAGQV